MPPYPTSLKKKFDWNLRIRELIVSELYIIIDISAPIYSLRHSHLYGHADTCTPHIGTYTYVLMHTHIGVHTQTDLLSHSSMLQFRLLLTIIAETVTGRRNNLFYCSQGNSPSCSTAESQGVRI